MREGLWFLHHPREHLLGSEPLFLVSGLIRFSFFSPTGSENPKFFLEVPNAFFEFLSLTIALRCRSVFFLFCELYLKVGLDPENQ